MHDLLPLMIVPLMVWCAVWVYLYTLDGKVKALKREIGRDTKDDQ